MPKPIHVTDETFEEEVLKSTIPVITDFWADWCGPCIAMAPILEQIAVEHNGQLKVAKLDVDSNPATATRYGIRAIPMMIIFKDGEPVDALLGWMPKEQLLKKIERHLD